MKPTWKIGIVVFALAALLTLMVVPTRAEVVLLDAESRKELSTWKSNSRKDRLTSETRFATRGNCSLQLTVAGYAPGVDDRECVLSMKPDSTDWRDYDRLVLDIFNPGDAPTRMRVQIETSTDDARRNILMPPGRWLRMVIPVAQMDPELADISHVRELRFVVDRTATGIALHFDNVALLSQGENPPALPSAFREDVMGQLKPRIAHEENAYSQLRSAFVSKRASQVADWAAEQALAELRNIRSLLDSHGTPPGVLAGLGERFDRATRSLKRVSSIVDFALACDRAGTSRHQDILVGQGSSVTKLLPREMPLELSPAKEIKLSAARNETESFQIAVLPLRDSLIGVSVSCGDLRSKDGHRLARQRITCDVVGYVEIQDLPPYETPLVGWWPDPLLGWLGPIYVARGDLQSFWIRVRVPKDQAPGAYRGEAVVSGRGLREVRIPLTVTVRSFSLPSWSPLPTAITFGPPIAPYSRMLEDLAATPQWNAKLKFKWADMLADYYISYDHLYRNAPPDFEVIDHLRARGRLGAFNLGYFGVNKTPDGHANADELKSMLSWAKEGYRKAKERGLLKHAYIYGFDEVEEQWFGAVEETAAAVKVAMPGVMTLTTTYDDSCGRDSKIASIDGWTPKTSHYDLALADEARKRGDQVWWYICVAPNPPYANIFLECPAIDIRLLMGAMTTKYRPDGFLYYQTSLWKATEPIRTGPFTNWNPVSYRSSHGDGSWLCLREGGLPVPTMRLENYRDGLEDYAYVQLVEEAIRIKEGKLDSVLGKERQWLTEAKEAITVPKEMVASLTAYSRDPKRLHAWRERLAGIIEGSGLRDLNPWGKQFHFNGR